MDRSKIFFSLAILVFTKVAAQQLRANGCSNANNNASSRILQEMPVYTCSPDRNAPCNGLKSFGSYLGSNFHGQYCCFRNVALNQPASQKSTAYGGVASRAVNGNKNSNWSGGSITHTWGETNAWWEVDLGTNHTIFQIDLYNREDCCSDRIYGAVVEFINSQGQIVFSWDTGDRSFRYTNRAYIFFPDIVGLPGVTSWTPTSAAYTAQKIRVTLPGTGRVLSLAEVEIFASHKNAPPSLNPTMAPTTAPTIPAPHFGTLSYVTDLAKITAQLADDIYSDYEAFYEKYNSMSSFDFIAYTVDDESGAHGAILVRKTPESRDLFLVFRGTEDMTDANIDLWFDPQPYYLESKFREIDPDLQVATGFQTAFNGILAADGGVLVRDIEDAIKVDLDYDVDRIVVTGHSLGGAMSTLGALWLVAEASEEAGFLYSYNVAAKIFNYNYGSPAVGSRSFAQYYNSRMREGQSWRFVNIHDLVPKSVDAVNIFGVDYQHVDKEFVLEESSDTVSVAEAHSTLKYRQFVDNLYRQEHGRGGDSGSKVLSSMALHLQMSNAYFSGTDYDLYLSFPGFAKGQVLSPSGGFTRGRTYTFDIPLTLYEWETIADIPHTWTLQQDQEIGLCDTLLVCSDDAAIHSAFLEVNGETFSPVIIDQTLTHSNQISFVPFLQRRT